MSFKDKQKQTFFTHQLLLWSNTNDRPLPWKKEQNPYYIWLSEIILQQTRVEQGIAYYEKFKRCFPTVKHLADATEDTIMKSWEGLGYYSRARNLHATAKYIAYELNSTFPNTYEDILKLKGVGPYTAAAISSFAFGLPHAVLDGNVYRVLARFFGIHTPIDTTKGKKQFTELADKLLDKKAAGKYNQAIMDFGATVCLPAKPVCANCLLSSHCIAYQKDQIKKLPVKAKKIKKRERFFNYLVLKQENTFLIHKRIEKDIWKNLYQFPLVESSKLLTQNLLIVEADFQRIIQNQPFTINRISKPFKQQLTHQKIIAVFWELKINLAALNIPTSFFRIHEEKISNFALPKIIDLYLKDKSLYLKLF